MLILNRDGSNCDAEIHLMLEPQEALELIRSLSNLLRNPDFHHDHLDDGRSAVDVVVVYPNVLDGFTDAVAQALKEYFNSR